MTGSSDFERGVFVNCPFDEEFEPILQAILFCLVHLGFHPRIATERADSGEPRLEKIIGLIAACRLSIHDLSRCQALRAGERYRLNMPFELGLDHGCRQFGSARNRRKRILILDEERYRYQAAASDLAGLDVMAHAADPYKAMTCVRKWLSSLAEVRIDGPKRIFQRYEDFQGWHWQRLDYEGWSEDDIKEYPTKELLESIRLWVAQDRPLVFSPPNCS